MLKVKPKPLSLPCKMQPLPRQPLLLLSFKILYFSLAAAVPSPYPVYNYTWLIINEAGDVANATSQLATAIPWPNLFVDLCALAMGAAGKTWGTSNNFMPQPRPLNTTNRYSTVPGCYNGAARTYLTMAPIYVCPGSHRDWSLAGKCGHSESFYCAKWGCETTGDTYWNSSSTWDLITVKRLNPPAKQLNSGPTPFNPLCAHSWCNPLHIQFTAAGKKFPWEGAHSADWGLCLYVSGSDPGLTFSIKLLKEVPSFHPVAVDPNPFLHSSGGGSFLPKAATPPPP